MIDLENPEFYGKLLRWAWLISLAMLVLGYGIIFCKVTGRF